jgi:hypothetical protein
LVTLKPLPSVNQTAATPIQPVKDSEGNMYHTTINREPLQYFVYEKDGELEVTTVMPNSRHTTCWNDFDALVAFLLWHDEQETYESLRAATRG